MKEQENKKTNLAEEAGEYQASLSEETPQSPDAPSMNDARVNVANERLNQTASEDREVAPEAGDAADPTSEELGNHHRDE